MNKLICLMLAIAFFAFPAQVVAQLNVKKADRVVIRGATKAEIVGDRILAEKGSAVEVEDAAVVNVETEFKFVRLKARKDGARFSAEQLGTTSWLFVGTGKFLVEVVAFDPEKGIEESEIEFTIGAGPKPPEPPPGPDPGPIPPDDADDDLESFAKRVAAVAATIGPAEKMAFNKAMQEVVRKMKALEFRRIEEARTFIESKNLPANKLNQLLNDDAKARGSVSFQDAIRWFEAVEKGTR